ncbi:hypothetical protein ACHAWF_008081 [Thalassiosira exigua]
MPSSKKRRAKQRQRKGNDVADVVKISIDSNRAGISNREAQIEGFRYHLRQGDITAAQAVENIRVKEGIATAAVKRVIEVSVAAQDGASSTNAEADILVYRQLIDAGLVSTVLDLVNDGDELYGGTDYIMMLLSLLLADRSNNAFRRQVASSLGPVIKCMQNDIDREYFNSNKHWHCHISSFNALVGELSYDEDISQLLLEYKCLFEFILQSMFWETQREDIVNESKTFEADLSIIPHSAAYFIGNAVNQYDEQSKYGKEKLYEIATMPVISEAFDPNCDKLFMFGLLDMLNLRASKSYDYKQPFYKILIHLACGDCVDRKVIEGVISLGFSATEYEDAAGISLIMSSILIQKDGSLMAGPNPTTCVNKPYDQRYAVAIQCRLFEMCLQIVVRFGSLNNGQGKPEMNCMQSIHNIIEGAKHVSFEDKSSKSIANRRSEIIDALQQCKDDIPSNEICLHIAQTLQSIVDRKYKGGSRDLKAVCTHCSVVLEREEIKRCGNCKATYCSRKCQVDDWKYGSHKQSCGRLSDTSIFSKQDLALHSNLSAVASEIILKDHLRIRLKAVVMGYDVSDCVCLIDHRSSNPTPTLFTDEEFLAISPEEVQLTFTAARATKAKGLFPVASTTWGNMITEFLPGFIEDKMWTLVTGMNLVEDPTWYKSICEDILEDIDAAKNDEELCRIICNIEAGVYKPLN